MAKISNQEIYIIDNDVSDLDYIIGTDGNTTAKTNKNFLFGKLKAYFKSGLSPLTGGTLRFTEISYTGGLYATVEAMVNAIDPFFTIDQYHVVVVTLNGAKSILKLQDTQVGLDKTPVVAGDFIVLPTSVGPTGPQGIQGIQGAAGTNGTNGIDGADGIDGTNGTNGINAANNLQRDMSVSFSVADSDNNYIIQLKNATDIVVIIPDTLATAKFCCGFIRKGVGEVSFVGGGTMVLNNPVGYRINAQYDPAFIERDNASQICTLLGNLKV